MLPRSGDGAASVSSRWMRRTVETILPSCRAAGQPTELVLGTGVSRNWATRTRDQPAAPPFVMPPHEGDKEAAATSTLRGKQGQAYLLKSEERRVGKTGVSTCRSRRSPYQ